MTSVRCTKDEVSLQSSVVLMETRNHKANHRLDGHETPRKLWEFNYL